MTNSSGLVNLLNIIAFCYFDKSIMSWFTYALGKIFIGTFYTKLFLVYTNKASGGLRLMVAFLFLNGVGGKGIDEQLEKEDSRTLGCGCRLQFK